MATKKTTTEPLDPTLGDEELEDALISGEQRDLLELYFGEDAYEDMRVLAGRARTARTRGGPRVLLLPGIMGSKLGTKSKKSDDLLWIDAFDILRGKLTKLSLLDGDRDIQAVGVLLISYLKLKLRLNIAGFDTKFHAFDWRQDIPSLGSELAERIRRQTHPKQGRQDVYLVAHSMGGLVARAAIKLLQDSDEETKVRRLVMLGTPNYGSFAPVQAMSGNYSLIKKVAALAKNTHEELVNNVFNTFTGLYQMMPARSRYSAYDIYSTANWPDNGFAPRADILASAPLVHDHLAIGSERFILVAGVNQKTVVGVRREGEKFLFQQSQEGDGTVPLAFAQLEDVTTYYVEESHGSLPNNNRVARAVIDLLETGVTSELPSTLAAVRGDVSREVTPEELAPVPFGGREGKRISNSELRHLLDEVAAPPRGAREDAPSSISGGDVTLSGEAIVVGRKRQQRLDLRVIRGDITQVDTRAIVLGVFKGVAPSGAARAIDAELDFAISEFSERRMLSGAVGEVFLMPANRYRMGSEIVVFVGLGTHDDFGEEALRLAAENAARVLVRTKVDDFATVLMSAGSGLPEADVLSNLMEGFARGLREGDDQGRLRSIAFVENDRERFNSMHRDLLQLTTTPMFDDVEATVYREELEPARQASVSGRPGAAPVGPDPAYLLVREMPERGEQPTDNSVAASFTIRASLLSSGSRATVVTDTIDVDAGVLNAHLSFIESRSFSPARIEDFGQQLGELVLPPLVSKALVGVPEAPLVVIHDARTSRIPWETLNVPVGDRHWYPAKEAGLSRKYEAEGMSVAKWLETPRYRRELAVLLVVDPTEDLPGARKEGALIRDVLKQDPLIAVDELWQAEATTTAITAALKSGKYDVVHYAGHAFFDPVNRARSGLLCAGRQVLSGSDLVRVENLPGLVVFNACESARVRKVVEREEGRATAHRLETNVGLAEALLRAGVGNYIGTYWPVGDAPAKAFGETFYRSITTGQTIGEALLQGRLQVEQLGSVDWADYVHYGSPNFRVKLPG